MRGGENLSLYVIGDVHLSLDTDKAMDVFKGWENYVDRLYENWNKTVKPDDTVVLAGDSSWGMTLEQSKKDLEFINNLPGKKILLKGNHDYWWTTVKKMEDFFVANNFTTLNILHNNCYSYGEYAICGTRGWVNETKEPADAKVLAREAARLKTSIECAIKQGLEPIVFLHYPPIFANNCNYDILDVLYKYNIKHCYYGHIHGRGAVYAINGVRDGVDFHYISSDYLQFTPKRVL